MRKLIITGLMLATALPGVAQAQTAREVREDARDLRDARRDLQDARRYGDRDDRRDARRDVRDARRDYREELRDYRQRNRQLYRQGAYVGPRGYRYAPANVGGTLNRSLYARNYYVANPTRYRLPPVARNQQWVRHGNDVLLVDVRTGRVLDVNRNFFW
jgi:Ni/Co efflux regulator RcnB